jgi:hypothetical protein
VANAFYYLKLQAQRAAIISRKRFGNFLPFSLSVKDKKNLLKQVFFIFFRYLKKTSP